MQHIAHILKLETEEGYSADDGIMRKATTPVFIAGADMGKPEMRAASIKGVMQYIWRAVQCAPDIGGQLETEGELFGKAI